MAYRQYSCDRCDWYIHPGDGYTAYVWAIRDGNGSRIYVERFHDYDCGYDPDQDRHLWDEDDQDMAEAA